MNQQALLHRLKRSPGLNDDQKSYHTKFNSVYYEDSSDMITYMIVIGVILLILAIVAIVAFVCIRHQTRTQFVGRAFDVQMFPTVDLRQINPPPPYPTQGLGPITSSGPPGFQLSQAPPPYPLV